MSCTDTVKGILTQDEISRILKPQSMAYQWNRKLSSTRNISVRWNGLETLTDLDLRHFRYVVLSDGRVDINCPDDLAEKIIPDLGPRLLSLLPPKQWKIQYINFLINPARNTNVQDWHQDNGDLGNDYYTVLIPLVDVPGMGRTEILTDDGTIIVPDVSVGDALIFSGSVWHRGTANLSNMSRYCIYLVVSCRDKSLLFENW